MNAIKFCEMMHSFRIVVLCTISAFVCSFTTLTEMKESFTSIAGDVTGTMEALLPFREKCKMIKDMSAAVNATLHRYILSQDEAIASIHDVIGAWESKRDAGYFEPLVLAMTGSTGIGKSDTAYFMAKAIFGSSASLGPDSREAPDGLLVFNGGDFSSTSEVAALGLPEIHRRIRTTIVNHLRRCNGNAVIVFDEVQQVVPGTLNVLMTAISERATVSSFTDPSPQDNRKRSFSDRYFSGGRETLIEDSTARVIFIFIADVGATVMRNLVLAHKSRAAIPQSSLRKVVKSTFDDQLKRLQFSKFISEVIPFLPLEYVHVKEILQNKIAEYNIQFQGKHWKELIVDSEVIALLAGPPYVEYTVHKQDFPVGDTGRVVSRSMEFATEGARALKSGPLRDLGKKLHRHMRSWRPAEVLHVGLTEKGDISSARYLWGVDNVAEGLVFFQWCHYEDVLSANPPAEIGEIIKNLTVPRSVAFSKICETVHYGKWDLEK